MYLSIGPHNQECFTFGSHNKQFCTIGSHKKNIFVIGSHNQDFFTIWSHNQHFFSVWPRREKLLNIPSHKQEFFTTGSHNGTFFNIGSPKKVTLHQQVLQEVQTPIRWSHTEICFHDPAIFCPAKNPFTILPRWKKSPTVQPHKNKLLTTRHREERFFTNQSRMCRSLCPKVRVDSLRRSMLFRKE